MAKPQAHTLQYEGSNPSGFSNIIKESNMKFLCPYCGTKKLEMVFNRQNMTHIKEVCANGEVCLNLTEQSDVDKYQCTYCGYILKDRNKKNILFQNDLVKWLGNMRNNP
jgi:rubredoxin